MILDVNGKRTEVARTRDALTSVMPTEPMALVHERADGAVLRALGSSASGFAIEVRGGHTGDQSSASRSVPPSAVETMFDRFVAGDTGWPGAVVWHQDVPVATHRRRTGGVRVLAFVIGVVVGFATLVVVRTYLTVPWLCDRDGREVDTVRLGALGVGRSGTECVFVDGSVVSVFDLDAGLAWAELGATIAVALVAGSLAAKVVSAVGRR